ncbi:MAG TPA: PTS ascorbate transporter subunit IIC [Thermaerobacter sp.]
MSITAIAKFLADNIFNQPALLIGLVAMVGLIAQKKGVSDVIQGTIKAIAGFLIIGIGAGVLVEALNKFTPIVQAAFGITQPPAQGMGLDKFMAEYSDDATLVMTFGFLLNVLLARFTPARNIYLTGHLMFWIALTLIAVMVEVNPQISQTQLVVAGSIVAGLYWTLQPLYVQRFMNRITGTTDLAYGHTSSSNVFLAGLLGGWLGNPERSTENLKLPKNLSFFRDVTVSTSIVVAVVAAIAAIAAGRGAVQEQAGSMHYIVYAALQGLRFGAGTAVLLMGVRMILAEIVPAFRGIAERVLPGARPALDCPIVFDFAPTAVLIGFLSAFASFSVLMLLFGALGWAVIIPPMIPLFFPGGAAGVFGNATGGLRGAILGGAITGVMLAVGQPIAAAMLSSTASELAVLADPDWFILIIVFKTVFGWIFG